MRHSFSYFTCLGILFSCTAGAAPTDSLCSNTEETVFSCRFKTKFVSVCGKSDEAGRLLYAQYRFGAKNVEIAVPPKEPFDLGRIAGQVFSGAHGGAEEIVFTNGEYAYRIETTWDMRNGNHDFAEVKAEKSGATISRFQCKPVGVLGRDDQGLRRLIRESGMKALP